MRLRALAVAAVATAGLLGSASTARANMIVNGDFEAGGVGWTFSGPGGTGAAGDGFGVRPALVDPGHGTLERNGFRVGGLEWSPGTTTMSQTVSGFVAGDTYRLEWDLNLRDKDGGGNNSFAVFLDQMDAIVPGAHTLFSGGNPDTWANGYTHLSVDFVATGATHTIIFGGQGFPSDVSYNFDNVSLKAVPEPTSLALLGVAGVAALRRRRRR